MPPAEELPAIKVGGGGGSAGAATKDHAAEVIAALQQEVDLSNANTESRKRVVEQIRLANELTRAGVDLDSEQGQKIQELVRGLYQAREAAEANERAVRGINDAWNFAGQQVLSIVDSLGEKGKSVNSIFASLLKTIAKSAEQAAVMGTGPLAGILGTANKDTSNPGAPGGIIGALAGLFVSGVLLPPSQCVMRGECDLVIRRSACVYV